MGQPFNSSRHNSGTTCHMVDIAQNLITKAQVYFFNFTQFAHVRNSFC